MNNINARFISFDGVDGTGKTTQLQLFKQYLDKKGIHNSSLKEPLNFPGYSDKLVMLLKKNIVNPYNEILIQTALRLKHVQEFILPSLKDGHYVLCDRYLDATIAYQCFGSLSNRNISLEKASHHELEHEIMDNIIPREIDPTVKELLLAAIDPNVEERIANTTPDDVFVDSINTITKYLQITCNKCDIFSIWNALCFTLMLHTKYIKLIPSTTYCLDSNKSLRPLDLEDRYESDNFSSRQFTRLGYAWIKQNFRLDKITERKKLYLINAIRTQEDIADLIQKTVPLI